MRIHLIAMGHKMPDWIQAGFKTYQTRLPRECDLTLTEIPLQARSGKKPLGPILATESEKMRRVIPARSRVIALDEHGIEWSTAELSKHLRSWMQEGRNIVLLIGGPEGLSKETLERADAVWSLSPLTFPHALARVIVAEQLYRAWTIVTGHPYHRE